MGILRTIRLLSLSLILTASSAAAMPEKTTDLAQAFASCLGRFSALQEHRWMTGESDAQAAARRARFRELLEAVRADAAQGGLSGAALINTQLGAKMAQARLLYAATYDADERMRRRAAAMARRQLGACETLVFG
ncbi:hypothetical protein [Pseudoponticoccus marisrubri]|uniref:Lysozyme inhibitor LprI N-terminal domain-containing protein n=1 Tax=Pseudoponticoccus marisrubri TaxID=1685382 RepID=A0A0W7WNZ9_9RHOB|nr:hypothetical protein [Pseudoponticoccus marisrubri]KUF12257.1 hypothetical protein AVJ23_00535 [Pseudoponticoccus marisrubri]